MRCVLIVGTLLFWDIIKVGEQGSERDTEHVRPRLIGCLIGRTLF